MILYIDTTDFNKVTFGLSWGKKLVKRSYKVEPRESHKTLAKLDDFFHKSKILNPKAEIKKIIVNKGPGSFTGVRVGVTMAMALGFAWGAPVKAIGKDKFITR